MVTDPVANMLARIRNAGQVQKDHVAVPYSKHVHAIAKALSDAGYVGAVEIEGEGAKKRVVVRLIYIDGELKISGMERLSKPSRRLYYGAEEIPEVKYGYGMLLLSTPKGILPDEAAREEGVGGEALFKVW